MDSGTLCDTVVSNHNVFTNDFSLFSGEFRTPSQLVWNLGCMPHI